MLEKAGCIRLWNRAIKSSCSFPAVFLFVLCTQFCRWEVGPFSIIPTSSTSDLVSFQSASVSCPQPGSSAGVEDCDQELQAGLSAWRGGFWEGVRREARGDGAGRGRETAGPGGEPGAQGVHGKAVCGWGCYVFRMGLRGRGIGDVIVWFSYAAGCASRRGLPVRGIEDIMV